MGSWLISKPQSLIDFYSSSILTISLIFFIFSLGLIFVFEIASLMPKLLRTLSETPSNRQNSEGRKISFPLILEVKSGYLVSLIFLP